MPAPAAPIITRALRIITVVRNNLLTEVERLDELEAELLQAGVQGGGGASATSPAAESAAAPVPQPPPTEGFSVSGFDSSGALSEFVVVEAGPPGPPPGQAPPGQELPPPAPPPPTPPPAEPAAEPAPQAAPELSEDLSIPLPLRQLARDQARAAAADLASDVCSRVPEDRRPPAARAPTPAPRWRERSQSQRRGDKIPAAAARSPEAPAPFLAPENPWQDLTAASSEPQWPSTTPVDQTEQPLGGPTSWGGGAAPESHPVPLGIATCGQRTVLSDPRGGARDRAAAARGVRPSGYETPQAITAVAGAANPHLRSSTFSIRVREGPWFIVRRARPATDEAVGGTIGCYVDFQRFAAQVVAPAALLPPGARYDWELRWDHFAEGKKFKYSWEEALGYWQQRYPGSTPEYVI